MFEHSYERDLRMLKDRYADDVMIAHATLGDSVERYRKCAALQRQFWLDAFLLKIEWGFTWLAFDVEAA